MFACLMGIWACGGADKQRANDEEDAGGNGDGIGDGDGADDGTVIRDAGGHAEPDAGMTPLPACDGVPKSGRCADDDTVEVCVTPTGGGGQPHAASYDCPLGESCVESSAGATCVLTADCVEGATRCSDASTLEVCAGGSYVASSCPRECVASPLGAFCAADLDTQPWTGSVSYETRFPNDDYTDWSATLTEVPAPGFLVLAYRGDELIDAVLTSEDEATAGTFSIRVPATITADDTLVVVAAGTNSQGQLAHVVVDPGYAPSSTVRSTFGDAPDPRIWSWSAALDAFNDGDTLRITEELGSGAARVFDFVHVVYTFGEGYYQPPDPQTLVVWLGIGTAWDCGACMAPLPVNALDFPFEHQLWLDGSSDEGYWSDPVTAHELGHYVMSAFGHPVAEGGPHFIGVPTNPGQAWSEGWATFFSSLMRDYSVYYDKQAGAFFWLDVDLRQYGDGATPWQRPARTAGLLQRMDENEVAALLWGTYESIGEPNAVLDAIASPRMTVPPFARGYTLRVWSDPENPGNFDDTGEPLPMLADFFDALRCDGAITASALDAITVPATFYPYPSESPLCE